MKVLSGKIRDGKVEVPPDVAAEGDQVMVLAPATGPAPQLSAEQDQELLKSMEDLRAGRSSDGDELVQGL